MSDEKTQSVASAVKGSKVTGSQSATTSAAAAVATWDEVAEQIASVVAPKSERDVFVDWQKHRNAALSLLEQTSRIFAAQYPDESTLRVAEALLARFKMHDDQCTMLIADAERALKNLSRIVPRVQGCLANSIDQSKEIVYDIQLIVKAHVKDARLYEKAFADLSEIERPIVDAEEKLPSGTKIKFEGVKVVSSSSSSVVASSSGSSPPNATSLAGSTPPSSSLSVRSASPSPTHPSSTPLASPRQTKDGGKPEKMSDKEIKASFVEAGFVVCILAVDQGLAVVLLSGGLTTQKINVVGPSAAKHSFPFLIVNSDVQRLLQQYANEFNMCHRYAHTRLRQLKTDIEKLEALSQRLTAQSIAWPVVAETTTGTASLQAAMARLSELDSMYSDQLANKREVVVGAPNTDAYVTGALKDSSVHHLLQVAQNTSLLGPMVHALPEPSSPPDT